MDNLLEASGPAPACRGQVYRFIETGHVGKRGNLVCQRELRLLKRLSCPGCEVCYGNDDVLNGVAEEGAAFLQFSNEITTGDLVRLVMEIDERDRETGTPELWHYNVVPLEG